MERSNDKGRCWFICLALLFGTLAGYAFVLQCGFINFDDPVYVVDNAHVHGGISFKQIIWAFTTGRGSNWHPLTWISHMVDCEVYAQNAAGHHLTNLLLHLANVFLLFALLKKISGATWRSAIVAALFAWHPLHVESVAWISERKDVLSTFFFLWTLIFYARFAETTGNSRKNYLLALLFFALGLMSKPMVVTLPFVLLLLDYWPLRRFTIHDSRFTLGRLVREKIPFFALSIVSCVITFLVQKRGGSVIALGKMPFSDRVSNALTACVGYLRKIIWPDDLAVFYPRPDSWPMREVCWAALILVALTLLVIFFRRSRPFAVVGWLWFLGTLLPVIGLVQVGEQAMADRYTYIPSIGIFIAAVWGIASVTENWPRPGRLILKMAVAIVLAACIAATWFQVRHWKSSLTLFTRARNITADNVTTRLNLGVALEALGRRDEALENYNSALRLEPARPQALYDIAVLFHHNDKLEVAKKYYEAALRAWPDYGKAHYNMGTILAKEDKVDEALFHFRACVQADAESAGAYSKIGGILLFRGDTDGAIDSFRAAMRLQPDFAEVEDQLGGVFQKLGNLDAAREHYSEALRLDPNLVHARLKLGLLYAQHEEFETAKGHFLKVIELEPTNDTAHYNLAAVFAAQGRFSAAVEGFQKAVELKPSDADSRGRLATALAQSGKFPAAIAQYREAIRLNPDWAEALRSLAMILATNPDANIRDGAQAVEFAERADKLTRHSDARMLAVLGEAYAEAGRFDDAVKVAEMVKEIANASKQTVLAEKAAHRLELYRARKPFHE